MPLHPTSWRYIFLTSINLRLDIPSPSFPSDSHQKPWYAWNMPHSSLSPWFCHPFTIYHILIAPLYAVFSSLLSLPLSQVQIFSLTTCLQTSSAYIKYAPTSAVILILINLGARRYVVHTLLNEITALLCVSSIWCSRIDIYFFPVWLR